MYETYRGKAAFYVVYIGEAHPNDAWQLPSNLKDHVVYESPKDFGAWVRRSESDPFAARKVIHLGA